MSGVWCFKNGVVRLVENPGDCPRRKLLVHLPTNEAITSYEVLERKLSSLGWERDFSKFKSIHMYDIVVKNRNEFEVRDM
ncbi:UNVERIFIED_CONTAM: Flowering-promoting factor 1-like protein 3 [Sesamum latifolium]|uniref:Flowering-promoting factor 1-like protein 3 n=1 Tax=Sesamum latifolium TaxID=2727402 RepID=A0AAW2XTF6_9LAMI